MKEYNCHFRRGESVRLCSSRPPNDERQLRLKASWYGGVSVLCGVGKARTHFCGPPIVVESGRHESRYIYVWLWVSKNFVRP